MKKHEKAEAKAKTAVIYARQSYGSEALSLSIEQQIIRCSAWCEQHDVEIKGVFKDFNTSSELYEDSEEGRKACEADLGWQRWLKRSREWEGRKAFRKGLAEAFSTLAKQHIDFFVVDEVTRFYRNPWTTAQLDIHCILKLQEAETSLVTVSDGHINDLSSSVDIAMRRALQAFETEALMQKAENSKKNRRANINRGIVFSNAFGIDWKNKKICFNSEKIEAVKYVFSSVISGKTYGEILFNLNSRFKHMADGKCFYESSIYNIVKNPIYSGFKRLDDGRYIKVQNLSNSAPVSFIEWEKANAIVKDKKEKSGKQKYNVKDKDSRNFLPFSGLLKCGNCGRKLVIGKDKGGLFYHCKEVQLTKNKLCSPSWIRLSWDQDEDDFYLTFQPLFLLTIQKMMIDLMKIKNANEEKNNLQVELNNLKNRLKNITSAYSDGNIEEDIFHSSVEALKAKIIEKQNELVKASAIADEDKEAELQKFRILMDQLQYAETRLDDDDYARLVRETFRELIVFEDRIKVVLFDGNSFEIPRILVDKRGKKKLPSCKAETFLEEGRMYFRIVFEGEKSETLVKSDFFSIETR